MLGKRLVRLLELAILMTARNKNIFRLEQKYIIYLLFDNNKLESEILHFNKKCICINITI